jgi:hypothetical protein
MFFRTTLVAFRKVEDKFEKFMFSMDITEKSLSKKTPFCPYLGELEFIFSCTWISTLELGMWGLRAR